MRDESSHMPLTRIERWLLLFLFLGSLGLRLCYLSGIQESAFFGHPRLDAQFHDKWAQSISSGNVVGNSVYFRAPLYAYLLGMTYAIFGHDYVVPRIIQYVLGSFLSSSCIWLVVEFSERSPV